MTVPAVCLFLYDSDRAASAGHLHQVQAARRFRWCFARIIHSLILWIASS